MHPHHRRERRRQDRYSQGCWGAQGTVRGWWGEGHSPSTHSPTPVTPCPSLTEASKLVMSYVAAVSSKGEEVNKVKEQLLQSNPVLEGECPTS